MSLHRVSSLLAGLLGSLALAGLATAAAADKVTICHFPPGNPANFQTITIAPSALPAHLAHHDFGGPCENDCNLFGSVCDDGNACTVDTCNADGTCASSAPTNCDDGNRCTADSCDPGTGACVTTPVSTSTPCDDNNPCTSADHCDSSGECHGAPIAGCCTTNAACDDQNPCTDDTCDLGTHTCTNSTKTCTPSDVCHTASCAPDDGTCVEAPIDCDDGDACTTDTCDPTTGCAHTPITCGAGQTCVAGACVSNFDCAAHGGTVVAGYDGCWFLGSYGLSCTQVCSGQSLDNSALTVSVAGSGGTKEACQAVLTALGATPAQHCDGSLIAPATSYGDAGAPTGWAVGCTVIDLLIEQPDQCDAYQNLRDRYDWYHVVSPATVLDDSQPWFARACACQ